MPTNELTLVQETPLGKAISADETSSAPKTAGDDAPMSNPNLSFEDLQRVVHLLARAQKFQLLQFVVAELAESEKEEPMPFPKEAEIWSPFDAYQAAAVMAQALEREGV